MEKLDLTLNIYINNESASAGSFNGVRNWRDIYYRVFGIEIREMVRITTSNTCLNM